MCAEIAKAALKHQRLAQPFDVATCERQLAERQRGRLLSLVVGRFELRPLASKWKPERHDQRPHENRIRQRVWRGVEFATVRVERRQRLPQLWTSTTMELGRDRFEKADLVQCAERGLRRPGAQNLVVLLDQPRR